MPKDTSNPLTAAIVADPVALERWLRKTSRTTWLSTLLAAFRRTL